MKLFLSPHNDDETLFGAFTLLREQPLVVVCYDSYVQFQRGLKVTWEQRQAETRAALDILGCEVKFLGLRDDIPEGGALNAALRQFGQPERVYAPLWEVEGHAQHNLVALEATACFDAPVRYLTYTTKGKSTSVHPVPILDAAWIAKKLRAMACYESQHSLDPRMGCWPHFTRELTEYYAS